MLHIGKDIRVFQTKQKRWFKFFMHRQNFAKVAWLVSMTTWHLAFF